MSMHILDMLKRSRQNDSLKKSPYYKIKGSDYHPKDTTVLVDHTRTTPEELAQIARETKQEAQQAFKRKVVVLIISAIVTVVVACLLMWGINTLLLR